MGNYHVHVRFFGGEGSQGPELSGVRKMNEAKAIETLSFHSGIVVELQRLKMPAGNKDSLEASDHIKAWNW